MRLTPDEIARKHGLSERHARRLLAKNDPRIYDTPCPVSPVVSERTPDQWARIWMGIVTEKLDAAAQILRPINYEKVTDIRDHVAGIRNRILEQHQALRDLLATWKGGQ